MERLCKKAVKSYHNYNPHKTKIFFYSFSYKIDNICSGNRISEAAFLKLVEFDLAEHEDDEMVLSEAGRSLQRKMKLQPKVMKKSIIKTQNKPTFLDELLGEL